MMKALRHGYTDMGLPKMDGAPQEGLPVYAFDGATYTGYHGTTDANGEVQLTLPEGSYRFRADLNPPSGAGGTQFWSGEVNHCAIPGCEAASITVTIPLTVTVQSQTGSPYPDLPVYAFSGGSYTGFHGTSDANGQVLFTLPEGDYRFRADLDNVQFWSDLTDHCSVPGCLQAVVEIPGGTGEVSVTIDYTYDALYRLTAADYDTAEFFHYTYDAVGNRLTQETHEGTNAYVYDIANRLTEVDGVAFAWDANGNLISDGVSTYSYDHANRLVSVVQGADLYEFRYNGLGERLRQTVNGEPTTYTLDLNAGLTQVLANGSSVYLYGVGRIGELASNGWAYHQGDAIGSIRQMTDADSVVDHIKNYAPFGDVIDSSGDAVTAYGFAGEYSDAMGLVFLRARYYAPIQGRFLNLDLWGGSDSRPLSLNGYTYAELNPLLNIDPSGLCIQRGWNDPRGGLFSEETCNMLEQIYIDASRGNYSDLLRMHEWYEKLADAADRDGNNQAAMNLRHFLQGTGEPLRLSDAFMQEVWNWDYVQDKTNKLVIWYVRSKIPSLIKCQLTDIGRAGFARQITVFDNPGAWFNQPTADIAGSLGNFRLDVVITGTLHKQGWWRGRTETDLNLHLAVLDYYEWHSGVSAPVEVNGKIYEIPDDWALLLKRRGLGAHFLVRGDIDVSFTQDVRSLLFGIKVGNNPPDEWYPASCIGINFENPDYPMGTCAPEAP